MNKYTFISNSENDTKNLAKQLAKKLNTGDILILTGDLGSGKTKFTEGFLNNFNLDKEISSPTFNIVNEYENSNIKIFHFDVYRLESVDEFYEIGGEEYFSSGICIIEWGEIIKDALPNEYIKITFEKDNNDINKRILIIEAFGNKFKNIFNDIIRGGNT